MSLQNTLIVRFKAAIMSLGACLGLFDLLAIGAEPSSADVNSDTATANRVSQACERAKLMHEIYTATLDVIHERYFHGEKAIVPARALEDVFAEIKRNSKTEARWIAVNLKPMSVSHEPKTDFEKRAAKALATGKQEFEEVAEDYYRRAGAITLTSGCITCHAGFFKDLPKTPKYAGLVISIPLTDPAEPAK